MSLPWSVRRALLFPSLLLLTCGFAVSAQQKVETAQDVNQRLEQLASSFRSRPADYIIGSGDMLHVEVFDVPDLSRDVQVGYAGYISLPLIPVRVQAVGLTTYQLEQKLTEILQVNGLVTHPQITVSVREHRSHPIMIIGAVKKPMVYQAARETTLIEVLSEAGGIADDAGNVVIVTRPTDPPPAGDSASKTEPKVDGARPEPMQSVTISLSDLLETGDARFNVPLSGGETVSVPRAGIVYAVGAVDRSGGFVMQNNNEQMTALKLIALANGLKPTAKLQDAVIIRRNPGTGEKKEIGVDLKKIMARKSEDVTLMANDILFVPDSAGKRALRRMGDVALSLTTGVAVIRAGR
jgi:polysaccharide export outer membrane protein